MYCESDYYGETDETREEDRRAAFDGGDEYAAEMRADHIEYLEAKERDNARMRGECPVMLALASFTRSYSYAIATTTKEAA
jgi:hypothetical protein